MRTFFYFLSLGVTSDGVHYTAIGFDSLECCLVGIRLKAPSQAR